VTAPRCAVPISKSVPASVVLDSQAYGKMYMSPVSLARFGADAGTTNRGIDLVGLDLRFGDRPRLHRVRHDHPGHPRLDRADDRVRVARRLDRDLVLGAQAVGEHAQALAADLYLPGMSDSSLLPDRDLRELAMHIQTNASPSHNFTSTVDQ
jgi:hypothetical protein